MEQIAEVYRKAPGELVVAVRRLQAFYEQLRLDADKSVRDAEQRLTSSKTQQHRIAMLGENVERLVDLATKLAAAEELAAMESPSEHPKQPEKE